MSPYEELMQEPPGGMNHGYAARLIRSKQMEDGTETRDTRRGSRSLGYEQETDFLYAGGWSIFDAPKLGVSRSGASAHRGVIHPDEHVDQESLKATVAEKLGFTAEEIETAFSNGRPSLQRASLRAQIDARLLALSRAGGNMLALAKALGWDLIEERAGGAGASCRRMERALVRARAAEAVAA